AFKKSGALQKRPIAFKSGVTELVGELLERAEFLMNSSISEVYKKHLFKARNVFEDFAGWMGCRPYLASRELLVDFFTWLKVTGRLSELSTCLAAVAREYKMRDFEDPTKGSSICFLVESIKRMTS
ncbi:26279_t:CDS:1, partial [Dentiscutata erythropus]